MLQRFVGLVALMVLYAGLIFIRPTSDQMHLRCVDDSNKEYVHIKVIKWAPYIFWADTVGEAMLHKDSLYFMDIVKYNDFYVESKLSLGDFFSINKIEMSLTFNNKGEKFKGLCNSLKD